MDPETGQRISPEEVNLVIPYFGFIDEYIMAVIVFKCSTGIVTQRDLAQAPHYHLSINLPFWLRLPLQPVI
jgi:hypothetical protein